MMGLIQAEEQRRTERPAPSNGRVIDIGRDFSMTPGARYRRHGAYSGEEFRAMLASKLREAVANDYKLVVLIDTVKRSYLSSFLDEAFGGLIRDEHFDKSEVRQHLEIRSALPRFAKYKAMAEKYMLDA